jgi:hypothetical protein
MKLKSLVTCVSLLALASVTNAIQSEKAAAVNLGFNSVDTTRNTVITSPLGFGDVVTNRIVYYKDVATGVDARITATVTGNNYSFTDHEVNYTAAGNSNGDTGFDYQIASNRTGAGTMTYTIDLFSTTGGVHNYSTAYTASELRFLVYDVDGEPIQSEDLRIAAGGGFVGYQQGLGTNALTPSVAVDGSYLFSGHNVNVSETDPSSSVILYYQNTNSVTFKFEANTTTAQTGANYVFSAIDADLSIIGQQNTAFSDTATIQTKNYGAFVSTSSSTAVPEPFTIIGTIMGGTAAMRMRKKLKSSDKV